MNTASPSHRQSSPMHQNNELQICTRRRHHTLQSNSRTTRRSTNAPAKHIQHMLLKRILPDRLENRDWENASKTKQAKKQPGKLPTDQPPKLSGEKTFEKLITTRIHNFIEDKKIINTWQRAYLPKRKQTNTSTH